MANSDTHLLSLSDEDMLLTQSQESDSKSHSRRRSITFLTDHNVTNTYHTQDPSFLVVRTTRRSSTSNFDAGGGSRSYRELVDEIDRQCVVLRHVRFHFSHIVGSVLVKNICFSKLVEIRYTLDDWKTFRDDPTQYKPTRPSDIDIFTFDLDLSSEDIFNHDVTIQFAVRYRIMPEKRLNSRGEFVTDVAQTEFWDNNHGKNYKISFHVDMPKVQSGIFEFQESDSDNPLSHSAEDLFETPRVLSASVPESPIRVAQDDRLRLRSAQDGALSDGPENCQLSQERSSTQCAIAPSQSLPQTPRRVIKSILKKRSPNKLDMRRVKSFHLGDSVDICDQILEEKKLGVTSSPSSPEKKAPINAIKKPITLSKDDSSTLVTASKRLPPSRSLNFCNSWPSLSNDNSFNHHNIEKSLLREMDEDKSRLGLEEDLQAISIGSSMFEGLLSFH